MKLILCLYCGDIVRLFPERRTCKCGRSWGHYSADNCTTIQSANSLSIGLANPDVHEAIDALRRDPCAFAPDLCMRAWFNPFSEQDVRYAEDPQPTSTSTVSPSTLTG